MKIQTNARADENLTERIAKFENVINGDIKYRIPLTFLCNIGLVNHTRKADTKIICTLETDLAKLFESNVSVAAPDAKIRQHDAPFIQFEQIRLLDNLRQYLETSLHSKKVCRMGVKKTLLQKSYELPVGVQSYTIDFVAANRQYD